MKTANLAYLFSVVVLMAACSTPTETSENEDNTQTDLKPETVAVPVDTLPLTLVYFQTKGSESLMRGAYTEGQTEEEFIKNQENGASYEKLVNVDVAGSPFASDVKEEGFAERSDGTGKSKMVVYDMLYVENELVDQPFRVSVVTKVKDYKTWKWLYDMEEKNRTNAGMKQLQLGVNREDPNEVFMLIAIPDIAKAREMMDHPGLQSKMEQAGVIGKPIVKFWRPAGEQTENL